MVKLYFVIFLDKKKRKKKYKLPPLNCFENFDRLNSFAIYLSYCELLKIYYVFLLKKPPIMHLLEHNT